MIEDQIQMQQNLNQNFSEEMILSIRNNSEQIIQKRQIVDSQNQRDRSYQGRNGGNYQNNRKKINISYYRQKNYERSRSKEKKNRHDELQQKQSEQKIEIMVPQLTSCLYSFKQFLFYQVIFRFQNLQIQKSKIITQKLKKQYSYYQSDWHRGQNFKFFKKHKNQPWFKQKYDPQYKELLAQQRKQIIKRLSQKFFKNFKQGYYQNINLVIQQQTLLTFNQNIVKAISSEFFDISLSSQINIAKQLQFGFESDQNTIFLKLNGKTMFRKDLLSIVNKLPGYQSIYISEPNQNNNFQRYCWINFQDQITLQKACKQLNDLIINGEPVKITSSFSKNNKIKVLKKYPKSRITKDLKTIQTLIKILDIQNSINQNPLLNIEFQDIRKYFDLCLLYLRRVHAYDYFSGAQFECQRALSLKMGLTSLRIQTNEEQLSDFSIVYKKAQQAAEDRIIKKFKKKQIKLSIKQQVQNMILQKEQLNRTEIMTEKVWTCKYFDNCSKKFKACSYLVNHIIGKHPNISQLLKKINQNKIENKILQAYLNDPNKITYYSIVQNQRDRQLKLNDSNNIQNRNINRNRNTKLIQNKYYKKNKIKKINNMLLPLLDYYQRKGL